MKRFLMVLLLFVLAMGLFATGQQDDGPLVLGVDKGDFQLSFSEDGTDIGVDSGVYYWLDLVLKDYPEEVILREYSTDNTTIKMDVDIAGGDPPDVYWDYLGRINKYANSEFAVPINLKEEAEKYIPSYLDLLTKDDVLYGLPGTAWAAVMAVNKTLLESSGAGYLLPADDDTDRSWSMDAFLKATSMVQKKYGKGYYGYILFAAGTGGDYWSSFGWLAGFGAKLYENGKIVIDSPEGRAAIAFMKKMHDEGVVMPGAAGLNYADNLAGIANNNIVAIGGTPARAEWPTKLADGSGTVQAVIMEYPHMPGVEKVAITVGPNAGMLFKTGNPKREARALKLLKYIMNERVQTYDALYQIRYASLKGIPEVGSESKAWTTANGMIEQNGIFDMGLGLKHYAEVRELYPPMLQAIFSDELTIDEAIDRFVTEGTKILNE